MWKLRINPDMHFVCGGVCCSVWMAFLFLNFFFVLCLILGGGGWGRGWFSCRIACVFGSQNHF